jgi:sugar phosphate isomerase/epimerase
MYKALNPGMIGVTAPTLDDAIEAAESALFHAVEIDPYEISNIPAEDVLQKLQSAKMRAAAWGLPGLWRGTEPENKKVLSELPALAEKCSAIDCKRVYTWIGPGSDSFTFEENWKWHVDTLTPIAQILAEHDCRLGLEYVGPKTSRAGRKYEFVHDMSGMLDLCDAIGPNVGLMLDSWHWYTSHETLDQVRALTNQQAVHCHVNDAPVGIDADHQSDGKRELPGATGVIDIAGFLNALKSFGYDGPITPEPFNQGLRDMPSDEDRLEAIGYAMDKIWKLAGFK